MTRDLNGRCICGAVSYKARGRPDKAYACHCSDCQKRTGSAFALLLPVTAAHFSITGETTAVEQVEANGVVASLHLCRRCLTRLYTVNPIWRDLVILRAGTLEDTSDIRPAFHIWTNERQSWFALPTDIPWFETQPETPEAWRTLLS